MELIGDLDEERLVILMTPEQIRNYLARRRLVIVGDKMADLAKGMEIRPHQVTDMLAGRVPIGAKMMERLNKIDPEFDVVPLLGIMKKKGSKPRL